MRGIRVCSSVQLLGREEETDLSFGQQCTHETLSRRGEFNILVAASNDPWSWHALARSARREDGLVSLLTL